MKSAIRLLLRPLFGWVFAASLSINAFAQEPSETSKVGGVVERLHAAEGAPKEGKTHYWTTKWSYQDVDIARILSRLRSIGIVIPIDAEGDVSVELDVSVPLNRLSQGRAYRLQGTVTSNHLRLDDLQLTQVRAELAYDAGVLSLKLLDACWGETEPKPHGQTAEKIAPTGSPRMNHPSKSIAKPPTKGRLQGEASIELLPLGKLQAELDVNDLSLGSIQSWLLGATADRIAKGRLNGRITATADVDRLSELTAWSVDGEVDILDFCIGNTTPVTLRSGPLRFQKGVLLAESVGLTSPVSDLVRLVLACEVELIGRQRFQFRLTADDLPLETLSALFTAEKKLVSGKLDLDLHGKGEFSRYQWALRGQIGSPDLRVLGQHLGLFEHQLRFDQQLLDFRPVDESAAMLAGGMLIERVSAKYALDGDSLRVSDMSATLFGGTVQGAMNLARRTGGKHSLQLSWFNLSPRYVIHGLSRTPFPLNAKTAGRIDWTVPAGALDRPIEHRGEAEVQIQPIAIGASPIGLMELQANVNSSGVKIGGQGQLFGGKFSIDLASKVTAEDSWKSLIDRRPQGHARAERVRLDRVVSDLLPNFRRRVRGTADIRLTYQDESGSHRSVPTCQVDIRDLGLDGRVITRQLRLITMFRGHQIVLERIRGSFAGGRLWADGEWTLGKGTRQLQVGVSGIDISDAMFPLASSIGSSLEGTVSGSASITYVEGLRFRGACTARDSVVFNVPTGTLHSGVSGFVSQDSGHWKVRFPTIQGDLANGQVAGEVQLSSSLSRAKSFDMTSRWRAQRIDFGNLLSASNISTRIAHGQMSGELTLGGRGIRGVNDLRGRFDAKLGATQAAAIPGLLQADQFLGLITLRGSQFNRGRVKGLIGAGAAVIDHFELSSDRIKVWSSGKIRLDNLRMDMDVIISTGNFRLADERLLAFAAQLAMQSVFPVTTLVEVNRILRNRTIYLNFSGNLRNPRLRLKPLEIIREEALQFLLRELLVAASLQNN